MMGGFDWWIWGGLVWLGLAGAYLLGYQFGRAVAWGQIIDRRYEDLEALRRSERALLQEGPLDAPYLQEVNHLRWPAIYLYRDLQGEIQWNSWKPTDREAVEYRLAEEKR